jgi:hypothetical protein
MFEPDQPDLLGFEDRVLAAESGEPSCMRTAIGNLREDWPVALMWAASSGSVRPHGSPRVYCPATWQDSWRPGLGVEEEPTAALAARYGRDLRNPFEHGSSAAEPPWLDKVFLSARLPGLPDRR